MGVQEPDPDLASWNVTVMEPFSCMLRYQERVLLSDAACLLPKNEPAKAHVELIVKPRSQGKSIALNAF